MLILAQSIALPRLPSQRTFTGTAATVAKVCTRRKIAVEIDGDVICRVTVFILCARAVKLASAANDSIVNVPVITASHRNAQLHVSIHGVACYRTERSLMWRANGPLLGGRCTHQRPRVMSHQYYRTYELLFPWHWAAKGTSLVSGPFGNAIKFPLACLLKPSRNLIPPYTKKLNVSLYLA